MAKIKQQWKLALFVVCLLPVLLRLGVWQLERAQEKQLLYTVYQEQAELPAKTFDFRQQQLSTHYQPVQVRGRFDHQRYWLLDNQPRNSRVGYEVIMPLQVDGQWLFVNRGWVEAPARRDQLPAFDTPVGDIDVQGYLHKISDNAVFKQTASDLSLPWPKRVLQINVAEASSLFDGEIYPTVLRINEDSPGALITQWSVANTLPEKHQGYAVQWFAMAVVLCLLYVWALFKADVKPQQEQETI